MSDGVPPHPRARLASGRPPAGGGRGPRERHLSREAIVAAALRIVDADGVDAVTMRRVADELETGPASLYAHVHDKDELLAAVFDSVMGTFEVDLAPDSRRWEEQVKELARVFRRTLLAHRDLAKVSLGTIPTGPKALVGMEAMLAVLDAAGLPPKLVGYAGDLIAQLVTVSAYEDALFRGRMATPEDVARFHRELEAFFAALPPQFPTLRRLADDLVDPEEDDDARFEFGLDILVRGLATHVPRRGGVRRPR